MRKKRKIIPFKQTVYQNHKYNIADESERIYNGITFASKKEKNRYKNLMLLLGLGEISNLELQPKFLLQESFQYNNKTERAINYIADFQYIDKNGRTIVEDVKGYKTTEYKLKRKLFLKKYGNDLIFKEV